MRTIDPREWKQDMAEFEEKTAQFYAGTLDKGTYKGISGRYGSYAQRGGTASMLRLRMTAGTVTKEKLAFTAAVIQEYGVKRVHFTTCQTIQLHDLTQEAVCHIMDRALDAGIVTLGGGGDFPRNVMCSPLSGVEAGEYFDVRPWAEAAAEYLMHFIRAEKMPRKLKVGFSNSPDNVTHATYRDLGFAAREDGTFDVYSAGGLGNNPRFGVKMAEAVEPEKVLYHIKAMWLTFVAYGNYENRGRARTRYMQESLGGADKYREAYLEKMQEVFDSGEDLTLELVRAKEGEAERSAGSGERLCAAARTDRDMAGCGSGFGDRICAAEGSDDETTGQNSSSGDRIRAVARPVTKRGDGSVVSGRRVLPQKQPGLYTVIWHPLGGQPDPEIFCALSNMLEPMEEAQLRLGPDETAYIVNLTGAEAKQVLALTKDSAQTLFETSVSCIGSAICQIGVRDSQALLAEAVKAVREAGIPDGALPQIHISGCPSSCGTHQTGSLGFRGAAKKRDGNIRPAFACYADGCGKQGEEAMGKELGVMFEDEIPAFLVELGRAVSASGLDYAAWRRERPGELEAIAASYL